MPKRRRDTFPVTANKMLAMQMMQMVVEREFGPIARVYQCDFKDCIFERGQFTLDVDAMIALNVEESEIHHLEFRIILRKERNGSFGFSHLSFKPADGHPDLFSFETGPLTLMSA